MPTGGQGGAWLRGRERRNTKFLVADPFSGGGTVMFEAIRRGHRAYAQDLYAWPSHGLATDSDTRIDGVMNPCQIGVLNAENADCHLFIS